MSPRIDFNNANSLTFRILAGVRPDTFAVAVHESGHVVVGLALGVPFETVSIIPDSDSSGRVTYLAGLQIPKLEDGAIDLAGVLSEQQLNPHGEWLTVGMGDLRTACGKLDFTVDGVPDYSIRWKAFDMAEDAIRVYWGEILRLAHKLYVRREMTYAEVVALLCPKFHFMEIGQ